MRIEDFKEVANAGEEALVEDLLIFVSFDLVFALRALLVNLVLLRANE